MVCCISCSSPEFSGFDFFGWTGSEGCVGSEVPSAVLMILTSPVDGFSALSGGVIGGFVITGFATAGFVARRVRFLLRVCASASTKQKLIARQTVMRTLM